MSAPESLHIFAYGSLIWRPGFRYTRVSKVRVRGYERKFWQASHDHRGTDTHPGRVVTLVARADAQCIGLAYELNLQDLDVKTTLDGLDEREQDGYERVWLPAETIGGQHIDSVLTWIATANNPSWVGDEGNASTAEIIATRQGASGSNSEYLLNLHTALQDLEIDDPYITELVSLLALHEK